MRYFFAFVAVVTMGLVSWSAYLNLAHADDCFNEAAKEVICPETTQICTDTKIADCPPKYKEKKLFSNLFACGMVVNKNCLGSA
ncbi:MAG: hypothetical protein L0Y72_25015 [Gemmataceae bacterium]|nr:hypothetical protein [Gemmataceae bacterium]MCI0742306.1 hypothetical protein [Gemmataceae bacterium]